MTIPGVGQLTALAFVAAIDDPSRIRRSRDVGRPRRRDADDRRRDRGGSKARSRMDEGAGADRSGCARSCARMIKIAISEATFEAISATLPPGTVAFEQELNQHGQRHIWIDDREADKLAAMYGPGESVSDVILRIAAAKGARAP
jgi:transposase